MSYQILYSFRAEKYLTRLISSKVTIILNRIKYVSLNPFKQDNNIKKLLGTISSYRLRVGDIRVIYELNTQTRTMFVTKISPRGSVYDKISS